MANEIPNFDHVRLWRQEEIERAVRGCIGCKDVQTMVAIVQRSVTWRDFDEDEEEYATWLFNALKGEI